MTIRAHNTFRFGGFHVTVSRSGVSTSIGGRQARIATRPGRRGTRVSYKLPGGYRLRKG
jgi:hypothetical protein